MEDGLIGYILTGLVSLVVGFLLMRFEPKSKVCYWFPHAFVFDLKSEGLRIQTNSLTVQNLGRLTAESVEVIHKTKPDFFQISPPLPYTEEISNSGEHILRINSIGPKEVFTLQVLSYKTVPELLNIRSKEGAASSIPIVIQRYVPKWIELVVGLLMLAGFGVIVYWAIKAFIFLSQAIDFW